MHDVCKFLGLGPWRFTCSHNVMEFILYNIVNVCVYSLSEESYTNLCIFHISPCLKDICEKKLKKKKNKMLENDKKSVKDTSGFIRLITVKVCLSMCAIECSHLKTVYFFF